MAGMARVSLPHPGLVPVGSTIPFGLLTRSIDVRPGPRAITNHYNAVKAGRTSGGQPNYLMQGNDISPCMLGYYRGSLDQVSTELQPWLEPSSGQTGIGLPPFGRVAPFYKAARELAQSRFVDVWLYNDSYVTQCALPPVVNALFYEMLATAHFSETEPNNPVMVGEPCRRSGVLRLHRG